MLPKYSINEEPLEMFLVTERREKLYVPKLTTGGTMKYQKVNERTIKIIPTREINAGLRRLFLVFCKIVYLFLDFELVCYHAELLILCALFKKYAEVFVIYVNSLCSPW
jgi:hypothetical protein